MYTYLLLYVNNFKLKQMDYGSELLNYYFHFAKAVLSMKTIIAFNKTSEHLLSFELLAKVKDKHMNKYINN